MSLKRHINIGLISIAILPILLTSAIQLVTITFWTDNLIESNLINSSQTFKAIIEDFFMQQSIDMSIVSHMPEVRGLLEHATPERLKEVNDLFRKRVNDKYYIDFYLLYDREGNLVTTTNERLQDLYPHLPSKLESMVNGQVWYSDYLDHPLTASQSGIIMGFTPIIQSGEMIGFFGAGFNNTYLSRIIENVNLKNKIKVRLEDRQGDVVSTLGLFVLQENQPGNFKDVVSQIDFEKNPTGKITYVNYNYKEIAYYTPIEGTSLRLYTALNVLDYRYPVKTILTNMIIVFLLVSMIVGLIMTRIVFYINTYVEKTLDTMIRIKNGDFKARLSISGKGEIRYIADTFNDLLSTIEHNNDELYRSSERYRIAVKTFSDIFFELNIVEDTIELSATKWKTYYHLDEMKSYRKVFEWFHRELVVDEDKDLFYRFMEPGSLLEQFQKMEEGEITSISLDFRWHHPEGIQWVSMTLVPMYDRNGAMKSMVGYLRNIHNQKSREINLTMQAQLDGLTQVNNKVTTQRLVEEALRESDKDQTHALFIVDLDDFKLVNDRHGHLRGDEVLRDVASLLKSFCRTTDIVGRVGGDEFLIFLKNVTAHQANLKAEEIVTKFKQEMSDLQDGVSVTCSVGIAMYPDNGQDYMTLFEYADEALYVSKEAGKNQFTMTPHDS